jgi:acyl-coenzyme A thioesterase PaaI-like protein
MADGAALQDLIPNNHCWGCGPDNEEGLRIKSYWSGDETICTWQPGPPFFAGPPHVLNGGIIASIIDCHAVITAVADAYRREGREIGTPPDIWYATGSLSVNYLRPAPVSQPVTLRASVKERGERRTTVVCSLHANGEECARAEVVAVRVPESWRQNETQQ